MKKVIAGLTTLGLLAFAGPAFAAVNSSTITIGNTNTGTIDSDTNATASTGLNFAAGSTGGDGALGGTSGDANQGGDAGDATSGSGGAGGAGGNGGSGGLVVTGSAMADAGAVNSLNSNDFRLRVTDGGMNSSTLDGTNSNTGDIDEDTDATANTGLNAAAGSTGGNGNNGGNSGVATKSGTAGNATSGNGGNGGSGGTGGLGGEVRTGNSTSNAGAVNVLNTNMVRIRI